jgi:hypothetical protein
MNRPLKELYQILLDNFDDKRISKYGTCNKINDLLYKVDLISLDELNLLICNFIRNQPSIYKNEKFTKSLFFTGKGYWWTNNWFGDRQRKKFIKYLIQIS